jgi:hypothetical protein
MLYLGNRKSFSVVLQIRGIIELRMGESGDRNLLIVFRHRDRRKPDAPDSTIIGKSLDLPTLLKSPQSNGVNALGKSTIEKMLIRKSLILNGVM